MATRSQRPRLLGEWQEEITGTGKGGVIISKDLKEIIRHTKNAWEEENSDDEN